MEKQKGTPIKHKRPDDRHLQSLRNIGPSLEKKLKLIGINTVDDFVKTDPLELYNRLQAKLGSPIDRCVLYCFKGAELDLPWYECKRFFQLTDSSKFITYTTDIL